MYIYKISSNKYSYNQLHYYYRLWLRRTEMSILQSLLQFAQGL